MSYIKKRLYEGETICHRGEFHWLQVWGAWFALFGLGIFLIGIYIWAKMMIKFATVEFVVTNRRIVLKKGFLTARMDELELDAIEGGHVRQGFLGRIFGYGDVHYTGRGSYTLDLPVMAQPGEFVAQAEKARAASEEVPFNQLADELHDDMEGVVQRAAGLKRRQAGVPDDTIGQPQFR
ncbi:MAG: hypothetical protein CMK09_10715 [Ponticaulis sp.]|nr:hypothetical protein [Ponticaulis sp.]|tara:strand:- start:33812 stop:34348 length:537 start_codon:yes stop_codon:yes gene_type:complete